MPENDINFDVIQQQLAILMTNHVAIASKFYDLFVSQVPMDVALNVWTSENTFETINIPNIAKGRIPAKIGDGSPGGNVEAGFGTIYVDQSTGNIYIKTTESGPDGWKRLITDVDIVEHNLDPLAHITTIARINGDTGQIFRAADAIDPMDVVNLRTLDSATGGVDNLLTADKESLVGAINELRSAAEYESGCVVSGIKDVNTGKALLFYIEVISSSLVNLRATAPFRVQYPNRNLRNYTTDLVKELTLLPHGRYNIFIEGLSSDDSVAQKANDTLILTRGKYHIDTFRPYFMEVGDVWLDINGAPSQTKVLDSSLQLQDKNYAYLGQIVWEGP